MMIGLGMDIVEVDRVAKGMQNPRFLSRLLTPGERAHLRERLADPQTVAGRFAAKEAIVKALSTGIGRVSWQDIEIINDAAGRPKATLCGAAREVMLELGGSAMHVTIAHIRAIAAATAILEGEAT